jgi:hypothetical protein
MYFLFLIPAKEVIDKYFRLLTRDPGEAANWYTQKASLDWIIGMEKPAARIWGQHSIFQFFKTLPEMVYEIESYDCHPIAALPPLTMLVVSGKACAMSQSRQGYSFHTTMHIERDDNGSKGRIGSQTFFLFPV